MKYIDILLVALVTVYIVDLSGFTESWRSLLKDKLHIKAMKPLPPFDCGQCMTWWTCIAYSIVAGTFCLPVLAWIAFLSFMSIPIGQFFLFIREGANTIVRWLMDRT